MNLKISTIDELLKETQRALQNVPEGRLRISQNHGSEQYYRMRGAQDATGEYISKKEMQLVRVLAQKEYDRKLMQELEELRNFICCSEQKIRKKNEKILSLYGGMREGRKNLVDARIIDDEEYVKRWVEVEYQGKAFREDTPEIYTEKGERVRSKSEKLIADKLYILGIPYRYEYPFCMKGFGTVYPDFTLLNVKERKEWIWEHFGMMDDPEYAEAAVKKINLYQKNGILLGERLIATFETKNSVPDMRSVGRMLQCLWG